MKYLKILTGVSCLLLPTIISSCGQSAAPTEKAQPIAVANDGGSASERQIASLIRNHSRQKRNNMVWDSRLHAVAQNRARDMANRGYFSHVDPDGYGPNWHVGKAGYRLPVKWTAFKNSNQVESILAGIPEASCAFENWLGSKQHKTHLLGLSAFHKNQTRFGVGHVTVLGSRFKHYWVFISAPPES